MKKQATLMTMYSCEGLLYAVVVAVPVVYFKNRGLDNAWITFWTGLLTLPWSLKSLWAPFVDKSTNLRRFLLVVQICCVALLSLLVVGTKFHWSNALLLLLFGLLGKAAATQDLVVDATYLHCWTAHEQSRLMWLRNTAFRIAYLVGAGLFISLAGRLNETKGVSLLQGQGWPVILAMSAAFMLSSLVLIWFIFPPVQATKKVLNFFAAFKTFSETEHLWRILIYVCVFRFGDALLSAMVQPFLLDGKSAGGMNLSTTEVGLIYGTVGAIALIGGGIVGGACVSRYGVRPLLIPFSLFQSISILCYLGLSLWKPGVGWICATNAFEQFTFGLTTACYSIVLLMAISRDYRATHFAIISAVMNLSLLIPSMASGYVSDRLGYSNFFLLTFLLSLVGPLVSRLLPQNNYLDRSLL